LNRLLTGLLRDSAVVSVQNPVVLNELWEPEPDIAVLDFRADGYSQAHPRPAEVQLIIEVADSSTGEGPPDQAPGVR
jgi:Uma2 family endonuclease